MPCRKILISIIIPVLFVIIHSCEKELDYNDLDFQPRMVLNSLIYQDSIISVNVATTKSILEADTVLTFLENAEVKLYADDIYIETLIYDSLGMYHSTIRVHAGTNYRIEASANDIETAMASFDFDNMASFELININYQVVDTTLSIDEPIEADTNLLFVRLEFDMVFTDNAGEENYYDFASFGSIYSLTQYISFLDTSFLESKILSEGSSLNFYFRNYYDYDKYYSDGCSSHNGYKQNCFITDELFNGKEVSFELGTSFYTDNLDSVEIALLSYPFDYVHFHETGYRYLNVMDNPFSQPINVYSNVENGLGIVCAVSRNRQIIYLTQ